ncbi:hypothetical protein GCM10023084_80670 [Streptomyces lacrimifluminis]
MRAEAAQDRTKPALLTTATFCTQGWACAGAAVAVTEGSTVIAVALVRIAADRRSIRFMIRSPFPAGTVPAVIGE